MFERLLKNLNAPDLGGSFGSIRNVSLEDGKDILARTISHGIGIFINLGGPQDGKEFVLPLSGIGQGDARDDAILAVGGLVRRHGGPPLISRDAYPVRDGKTHWDTISLIQTNESEHFATPFIAVGRSSNIKNHPDLRHVTVESIGANSLNRLGIFYPAAEHSCRLWARHLISVIDAVESSGAKMYPSSSMGVLISNLRGQIRDDESNSQIAESLAEYEKTHGDRPHRNIQVPEYIRQRLEVRNR